VQEVPEYSSALVLADAGISTGISSSTRYTARNSRRSTGDAARSIRPPLSASRSIPKNRQTRRRRRRRLTVRTAMVASQPLIAAGSRHRSMPSPTSTKTSCHDERITSTYPCWEARQRRLPPYYVGLGPGSDTCAASGGNHALALLAVAAVAIWRMMSLVATHRTMPDVWAHVAGIPRRHFQQVNAN
jgi:hypothetical protein